MNKIDEEKLHKAIDETLYDNLSGTLTRPARIGIRELVLDAIEKAGFEISSGRDKQGGADRNAITHAESLTRGTLLDRESEYELHTKGASKFSRDYGVTQYVEDKKAERSRLHPTEYGKRVLPYSEAGQSPLIEWPDKVEGVSHPLTDGNKLVD